MSDIDLKSRYDIGWFSAYDTLKGMVKLYGFSKVLEALMEIGNLTPDAADDGDAMLFDGSQKMECGHEAKFIVYSERRNYCGICGQDAHPFNSWFRPTRRC